MKNLLTIAGSDSSGGAGIQGDLKTFSALGGYGMSVITAVTAQNTTGVKQVEAMDPPLVSAQINCILVDIPVDGIKIGMVYNSGIINAIAHCLRHWPGKNIVVDPIMVASSGQLLLQPEACQTLITDLFPLARLITPNIPEAEVLLQREILNLEEMKKAAQDLYRQVGTNVLIKGGHLTEGVTDVFFDGAELHSFVGSRIETKHTHGTGCALSSAITAYLAQGCSLVQAVEQAKEYTKEAIAHAFSLGAGVGSLHHFHRLYQEKTMF